MVPWKFVDPLGDNKSDYFLERQAIQCIFAVIGWNAYLGVFVVQSAHGLVPHHSRVDLIVKGIGNINCHASALILRCAMLHLNGDKAVRVYAHKRNIFIYNI